MNFTDYHSFTDSMPEGTWFLTGSRAWQLHSKDSDFDIVTTIELSDRIRAELDTLKTPIWLLKSNYYGLYFKLHNDAVINVIPKAPKEWTQWYEATRIMGIIRTHCSIALRLHYKPHRVKLFETLRELSCAQSTAG
jgi:hypothetical protein